jgi:hypothetical protein
MSNTILIKRNSTTGKVPATSALASGELALNTYDGNLFFKKTVSGVDSIVTLTQYSQGTGVTINSGSISIGQDVSVTSNPTFAGATFSPSNYANSLVIDQNGNVNVANNLNLLGTVTDSANTVGNYGQVLVSTGNGVQWQNQSGGSVIIKTFNIVGQFSAPLAGTSAYYVIQRVDMKSVQITNNGPAQQAIVVGLLQNGNVVQYFTLPAGQTTIKINTSTTISLFVNDVLTVNVISGIGNNFSMSLLNITV